MMSLHSHVSRVLGMILLIVFVNFLSLTLSNTTQNIWDAPNIICCQKVPGKDGTEWKQVNYENDPKPPSIYDDLHEKNESVIVVLIASLRETLLPNTLNSFFSNASHPERVHFAIVQQNAEGDKDIIEEYCTLIGKPVEVKKTEKGEFQISNPNNCEAVNRIRVLRMSDKEAKGPAYARGLGNQLVHDNDNFCMQIDAHTVVAKDWDILLLNQWASINNEFAVISTYPPEPAGLLHNSNNHWEMPHLCCVDPSDVPGVYRNCQAKAAANLQKPMLAPLWAAGLSFSKCHAERLVPNDPGLKQIFSGEEYSRAARLWTHGYDFYSLSRPVVSTWYGSKKGGKGGWKSNSTEYGDSVKRLQTLFNVPKSDQSEKALKDLGKYALGKRRTLEQYIKFSGIDPINNIVTVDPGRCEVHYVPWDDSGLRRRVSAKGRVEDGDLEISKETSKENDEKDEDEEEERKDFNQNTPLIPKTETEIENINSNSFSFTFIIFFIVIAIVIYKKFSSVRKLIPVKSRIV